MPLHKKYSFGTINIYVWHITEELDTLKQLARLSDTEIETFDSFNSESRKTEWCAIRAMLRSVIEPNGIIAYKANGAPLYTNNSATISDTTNISISHSCKFAALATCNTECGIDIEVPTRNFEKASRRFINKRENMIISQLPYDNNISMAIIWSLKESAFKFMNVENVDFKKDIEISEIKNGVIKYTFRGNTQIGRYIIEENYIITHTL